MNNSVLIVDQAPIAGFPNRESLFVNGEYILGADSTQDLPVKAIANNLAKSLGCEVETKALSTKALARSMAKHQGKMHEFEAHEKVSGAFDVWVVGYSSDDVFNAIRDDNEPTASIVIADFEIQDWHLTEVGEGWTGPKEHRDTYRFVIEQSPNTRQIFFRVYPKVLDGLADDLDRNGLSGRIEIRDGKPGISLGTSEWDSPVHIDSDIFTGLYIHCDPGSEPAIKMFNSFDLGAEFESYYYPCNNSEWLIGVRSEIANKYFERHAFGEITVIDDFGWEAEDTYWSKLFNFENPQGGGSVEGCYKLVFAQDSIVVLSESSV